MAIIGVGVLSSLVRAQQAPSSVYGSFLANSNGHFGSQNLQVLESGDAFAIHFTVYSGPPTIFYRLDEIALTLSRPATQTWVPHLETIDLEVWVGGGPGGTPSFMVQKRSNVTGGGVPDPWPSFTTYHTKPAPGDAYTLQPNVDYWLVVRYTSNDVNEVHQLNWHKNLAGVTGATAKTIFGTWVPDGAQVLQPDCKIRAIPLNQPCPAPAYMSANVFGTNPSASDIDLHVELICPPSQLLYYSCAHVAVPPNTTSFDASGMLASAVNNATQCGGGVPFSAERSGNIVRISQSNCPCGGAFICGDPYSPLGFAKTMGYQSEGVPMKLNMFFDGTASGIPEDPLLPAGVEVIRREYAHPDQGPLEFSVFFTPQPGATPDQVASQAETELRLAGDFFAAAVGDRVEFEAPVGGIDVVDQNNLSESGSMPIQALSPIGQSFAGTARIDYVDLRTYDGGGTDGATLEVRIRQNTITGTVLGASTPVDLPDGWNSPIPVRFTFPGGVTIPQGSTPVLEVVVVSGDPWLLATSPDAYPQGTSIIQGVPDAGADVWFSEGTTIEPGTGYFDLAYRINDTGLRWAIAPFDEPNPFELVEFCLADCNADQSLDILDFICFQEKWLLQDANADCNADGLFDPLDFICFRDAFLAGCP